MAQHGAGYKTDESKKSHIENCKLLLDSVRDGDHLAYGSTLLIAECIAVKDSSQQNKRITDEDVKSIFKRLLLSGKPIIPVQPTPKITELARTLAWDDGLTNGVGCMDRIHLATAIEMKCDVLITSDIRLINKGKLILSKYKIKIVSAEGLAHLIPEKNKQLTLTDSQNEE